ncbi:sensor histidine kinase [Halovenus marina]|uniref:sensor histidine kinase n=1 Tax=Halovenus marina TaxID=3396621 RepID=UPI003F561510
MTAPDDKPGIAETRDRTVQIAGQIVKYSREMYHLESVEEIATLAIEAIPNVLDGYPSSTVIEVRNGSLQILESVRSSQSPEGEAGRIAQYANQSGDVAVCAQSGTVRYSADNVTLVDPETVTEERDVTIAVPALYGIGDEQSGAILVVSWPSLEHVEEHHVKPVEFFAEHIGTAITNVRSRERLERARNDLEKRKEILEVYDRLLRHDLGNDLQVILSFAEAALERPITDDSVEEYLERIHQTGQDASKLVDDVGGTVKTLEQEDSPEPMDLDFILTNVIHTVEQKFENLTVAYDADEFDCEVYAGDLVSSVFQNILSNAAVHNDGAVTVDVYAETPSPDSVVVGLADDGDGISEEIREDLFEMGQRGPDSDGTGFGLGLVRSLVQSYGGSVAVRDSDAGGADFRVTLDQV